MGGERKIYVPRKKYLHQTLKFWLGHLLSRKGIEDCLDTFPHGPSEDLDAPIYDIWLSKVFRTLKDASGNSFLSPHGEEGRLVFSLSVDGFNPFYNKAAGRVASSTGIWLVVLNLPPHLRYLPENVLLVGVIPGPDKPAVDQINPYIKLLVDDLLEFWDPGIFFSRTHRCRSGRLFKAMLVPLVADMLAARQVIGIPGSVTTHSFCTFCNLDYNDIDIMNKAEWPTKNVDDIRHFAALWKEAASEKHQKQIFDAFGLRWSPLLNLPYWDPVHYTVIDSMHALDLGLFQTHCRLLFQIDLKVPGGDGSITKPLVVQDKLVEKDNTFNDCLKIIRQNKDEMIFKLLAFHRKILYTICIENNILGDGHSCVVGTRWVLARNIYLWVSSFLLL